MHIYIYIYIYYYYYCIVHNDIVWYIIAERQEPDITGDFTGLGFKRTDGVKPYIGLCRCVCITCIYMHITVCVYYVWGTLSSYVQCTCVCNYVYMYMHGWQKPYIGPGPALGTILLYVRVVYYNFWQIIV